MKALAILLLLCLAGCAKDPTNECSDKAAIKGNNNTVVVIGGPAETSVIKVDEDGNVIACYAKK